MFFKRILSEGLSHYSYIIGEGGQAAVIDPRLDFDIYLDHAQQANLTITHIFETHRNEDILLGSKGLADETGADVFISDYEVLGYKYGQPIKEGRTFKLADGLVIKPLHTPGHTKGHLSYVVEWAGKPYMVFTGDSLFYGGVGRSDFYGENELRKMTSLLHDSIYKKLAPLGSHVLVMPAHAAGSACGNKLDEIPYSTIGFELKNNKALSPDKKKFLKLNARMYYKNPQFSYMEKNNPKGGGLRMSNGLPVVGAMPKGAVIIDIRDRLAFLGGHIPGALANPADKLDNYAGWLIDPKATLVLLTDGVPADMVDNAHRTMLRMGHDRIAGVLSNGTMQQREVSGKSIAKLGEISPAEYLAMLDMPPEDVVTLDVRLPEERGEKDPLVNPLPIPLQELRKRAREVPADKRVFVLCGSGERATISASYLGSLGYNNLTVISGGYKGLMARYGK